MATSSPLRRIQQLIRSDQWSFSRHIGDYLAEGRFDIEDVVCCIERGMIIKSEADDLGEAVDGKKHTIAGPDTCGLSFHVVGKIVEGFDGKLFFAVTAYKEH